MLLRGESFERVTGDAASSIDFFPGAVYSNAQEEALESYWHLGLLKGRFLLFWGSRCGEFRVWGLGLKV